MTPEQIQAYSDEFDRVCLQRHEMGGKKYGPVQFLDVDSIEMMIEEVADLANYARYTFVKLRILQEAAMAQFATQAKLGRDGISKRLDDA